MTNPDSLSPKRRISQADLAAALGLAKSTVSKALSRNPEIPEETRERVLEAAAAMGYRPDPTLAVLTKYRWDNSHRPYMGTIAFLDLVDTDQLASDEILEIPLGQDAPVRGASGAALQTTCLRRDQTLGYEVTNFCIGPGKGARHRITEILHHRGIEGVVLVKRSWNAAEIGIDWSDLSVVSSSGKEDEEWSYHAVLPSYYGNSWTCLHELHRRGYRRIAFYSGSYENNMSRAPEAAYDLFVKMHGLAELNASQLPTGAGFRPALKTWIRKHRPEVFLQSGQPWLHDVLQKLSIEVPGEVGICGMHFSPLIPVSGVPSNWQGFQLAALNLLHGQLTRREKGKPAVPLTVHVRGHWRDSGTLRDEIKSS